MRGVGKRRTESEFAGEYVVYDEAARFLDYTEKYASTVA